MQIGKFGQLGNIQLSPRPERAGPSRVYVTCFNQIQSAAAIRRFVLTGAAGDGPPRQQPVRRLGSGQFVGYVDLKAGRYTLVVVARETDGTRLRGEFVLRVPGG